MNDKLVEYIEAGLKKDGYQGLCQEDCGCGLDDFIPCYDGDPSFCEPAYFIKKNSKACKSFRSDWPVCHDDCKDGCYRPTKELE